MSVERIAYFLRFLTLLPAKEKVGEVAGAFVKLNELTVLQCVHGWKQQTVACIYSQSPVD